MFASGKTAAVASAANYIEDVFSTYLYTGTGSNGLQIQNGIDLAGKGGLVFGKARSGANAGTVDWGWVDTTRGGSSVLYSNTTDAAQSTALVSSFNADGFTLNGAWPLNYYGSPYTYASWTFRKQAKFFDVVTYTGNGTAGRTVAHSLGSTPGCIIVKRTDAANGWAVYHRAMNASPQDYMMRLNATDGAFTTTPSRWNNTLPTSTEFTLSGNDEVNGSGATYVAYLFAHNAGGFGLTGTDNVISCGSFTAGTEVDLGWEPQWLLVKQSNGTAPWELIDNMRGFFAPPSTDTKYLVANTTAVEQSWGGEYYPTATGFKAGYASGTYIYIAIRRGPMKTPTTGTSVFSPNLSAATTGDAVTTNFPLDLQIAGYRSGLTPNFGFSDRLREISSTSTEVARYLTSTSTNAESTALNFRTLNWGNTGYNQDGYLSGTGAGIYWNFRRAPGFFDVVCFTATGSSTQSINHNLGVTPELIIEKVRNNTSDWAVQQIPADKYGSLNSSSAMSSLSSTGISAPTATVFSPAGFPSGRTEVAYLFASCPGVSKVGSYTGTGTTLQIDCGFTGGARFVLIKRTDSTGDWYVWDTARGIVSGNDPYLLLNSTAAETTGTDYIDTYSAGFEISSTAPAAINASGGTFIFLAIA